MASASEPLAPELLQALHAKLLEFGWRADALPTEAQLRRWLDLSSSEEYLRELVTGAVPLQTEASSAALAVVEFGVQHLGFEGFDGRLTCVCYLLVVSIV